MTLRMELWVEGRTDAAIRRRKDQTGDEALWELIAPHLRSAPP